MEHGTSVEFYEKLLQKAIHHIDSKQNGKAALVSAQLRVDGEQRILEENIRTIRAIISVLEKHGESVFNQIPWLDIHLDGSPYDYTQKFEIFWKGLIRSGRISKIIVPTESRGTRGVESEISYAIESGIDVIERKLEDLLSDETK